MPDLDQIKQGEQASVRPARAALQTADDRACGKGGRLSGRPAGGHHRAAEGGREALPRPRPRHLRNPARHPARRPVGRPGPVCEGVIPAFLTAKIAAAAE